MKKIIYTLVLLSSVATLQAQEYLTLERARELALEKNEDLKIAETTIQKSKAEQKAARSKHLPSLSAEATGIYTESNYETELYLPTYTPDLNTGELSPNVALDPSTSFSAYPAELVSGKEWQN